MVDLYILKIVKFPKDRIYENIEMISPECKKKIEKYKFIEDSYRSILGNLLVRYAIINRFRYKNNELKFSTSRYGKPYLKNQNTKSIHFNISHSGEYVICAIDNEICGVDVENIGNYSIDIANNTFHKDEVSKLHLYNNHEEAAKYFTFIWTMKEAYLKALGVGLSKSLSSFCVLKNNDKISIIDFETYSKNFNVFECRNIEDKYVVSFVGNNIPTYHYINDIELMEYAKKYKNNGATVI